MMSHFHTLQEAMSTKLQKAWDHFQVMMGSFPDLRSARLKQIVTNHHNQNTASVVPWVLGAYLISPWRKWPPFRRQYFQMHFHE